MSKSETSRTILRELLTEGKRRSLGRAEEVLELVQNQPRKLRSLVACLWEPDEALCMRAANILERLSRQNPGQLQPYKEELLGLLREATQLELRWGLTALLPRLELAPAESTRLANLLKSFLEEKSSILKTFALQGLFDLSLKNAALRPEVTELIRIHTRSGTAAMRARGRMLLKKLEAK